MDDLQKKYPFQCSLSFKPLIDYLDKHKEHLNTVMPCSTDTYKEILDKAPELYGPIDDLALLDRHADLVKRLMGLVFPPVYWNIEAVAAAIPFSTETIFVSPRFKQLFLNKDGSFTGHLNLDKESFHKARVIRAYLLILDKCYGLHQQLDYPLIRTVKDPDTNLERHFRLKFDFSFVDARPVGDLKPLSSEERSYIMDHLTEPEILREILPPEDFILCGFTVIQAIDVTESQILSGLERNLIDQDSIVSKEGFLRIQERLRTLFHRPKLVADFAAIQDDQILLINSGSQMTRCCIFADSHHIDISTSQGTVFEQAIKGEKIVRVHDVLKDPCLKHKQEELYQSGDRSLMIAPLIYKGQCIGILKLGSPEPGDFGPLDEMMMNHIQPIFSLAIKKALDDLDNQVQGVIKENCTAIHPTVEWRFRKAAFQHLENFRRGETSQMPSIVFKDVYPLYGISDIRGSTNERNRAIQKDLSEHLELALKALKLAHKARPILVLKELSSRVEQQLEQIKKKLGSGDELSVVKFISDEVESIFSHLRGFGPKVLRAIEKYESAIDPGLGSVYRFRKDFEESVSLLNNKLALYLDQEEAEAQQIFPHFFERHRTDGIDYLIYIGSSLMEKGDFNDLYLENLRLWQVKVAAGIAWHTEQLKASLKVPLDTAHLILVQATPLSIRFRFDEKRFDVDGAYDIRHEIIKSRLDKAVVKGGKERLTQPGKIAIVYSHPEEAAEMRRHIDFLKAEGYLTGKLENLELEPLPGVHGLRSLRIGVNLESQVLSQRIKQMAI